VQVKVIYYILIYDHVKVIYIIMGRAKNFKHAYSLKKDGREQQAVRRLDLLNCVTWNCNGLTCDCKPLQIAEVIRDHKIDIMNISETHLRVGRMKTCPPSLIILFILKSEKGEQKREGACYQ